MAFNDDEADLLVDSWQEESFHICIYMDDLCQIATHKMSQFTDPRAAILLNRFVVVERNRSLIGIVDYDGLVNIVPSIIVFLVQNL